jgi:O-antigen/teichoic acid export membrane protein
MADLHPVPVGTQDPGGVAPRTARRARPARNAVYLTGANLGAKAFSFVFVLYATRALGPALFGNYTTVLAFVGLFGVLTDLGLSTLAVRDVAQDRALAVRYVSNLLALRVLFSVVAVVLSVGLAQVYVAPSLRHAVYVYALALVPLAISNSLQLVFQFSERMAYSAVLNVAAAAATAALSILALSTGHHVLALTVVFTAVTAASTATMAWLVYTRFLPRRLELEPVWWPKLLRAALPFVLLTLLNILYSRADMQILYVLSGCGHRFGNTGCAPVGQYGAAYRVLDILVLIFVGSVNATTLPAFNRVVTESREALTRLVRSSSTLMLAFGVPVALFGTFYAREALQVLGGRSYLAAAPALAILVWAFPCFLVVSMFYNALYAVHRQGVVTAAFAVTLVFNVALNVVLIPRFSYLASAALTVASELVNGLIVVVALRRSIGSLRLGTAAAKITAVAGGVAAVLWALRGFGIVVGLPVGVVLVLLGLRLMRLIGTTEREILEGMPLIGRYAARL